MLEYALLVVLHLQLALPQNIFSPESCVNYIFLIVVKKVIYTSGTRWLVGSVSYAQRAPPTLSRLSFFSCFSCKLICNFGCFSPVQTSCLSSCCCVRVWHVIASHAMNDRAWAIAQLSLSQRPQGRKNEDGKKVQRLLILCFLGLDT